MLALTDWLKPFVEKLGHKKFAVLYDQSNAFAVSMLKPFKAYIEKRGGSVVAEETEGRLDGRGAACGLKESRPNTPAENGD